jgi:mRNA-degrading endonuclease toxin of MazEF toxin-antitoxin module
MRAGDVLVASFGEPVGSRQDTIRRCVVVTAQATLDVYVGTITIVPFALTSERAWGTDLDVTDTEIAQCHLVTTIARTSIRLESGQNIGEALLSQIRVIVGDVIDVPII